MELGNCVWPIDPSNCCDPPEESGQVNLIDRMTEVASTMLMRLSGYTIGVCESTVRPLGICPVCRGWCCGGADGLRLSGPMGLTVQDVTSVRIGATELPLTEWRFDKDLQTLWRVPPNRWPKRDERWSDCGEGEAFCVDLVTGTQPDAWALNVAEILTCELVNSCTGAKCRLPKNSTSITGQGITVRLSDEEVQNMLPEVRAWVSAVNPHGARLPAKVYSPDLRPAKGFVTSSSGAFQSVVGCCG